MKKAFALIALLTFVSSTAFAVEIVPADNNAGKTVSCTADGKVIGKLSASVKLGANFDTTGYAITTQHMKGTKTFGTSHDSTAIYANESLVTTAPGASDSSAFGSGWTAM